MIRLFQVVSALALLGAAACTSPYPVADLRDEEGISPAAPVFDPAAPGAERLLVVTMSGGGKRAAALAQGALNGLAATTLPDGRTMLDEIDVLSSTSGGSVTAARFALRGKDGFDEYRRKFLLLDVMPRLYWRLLNPVSFVRNVFIRNNRIEPLVDLFEEAVFAHATLGDVWQRPNAPYLILNATDIASGLTFSMTQPYFELLCADARPYPLARAVAASAAFPVALSPVTLENRSAASPECPRRQSLASYLDRRLQVDPGDPGAAAAPDDAAGRGWALRNSRLFDGEVKYVHLYDGGIADNLGLSEPLRMMSSAFRGNPYYLPLRDGPITDLTVLAVDARSNNEPDFEQNETAPGMLSTLLSVIGGTIDSRTSGLTVQASLLQSRGEEINMGRCFSAGVDRERESCLAAAKAGRYKRLESTAIVAGFDNLRDKTCRRAFAELPTDWALSGREVDALLALGEGLVMGDPRYQELATRAGTGHSQKEMEQRGNAKIAQACACIRAPDASCPQAK